EAYEPTRAARAISDFTQDYVSNWYVRLSRRRFWKGDYQTDKISAYQTLYTCMNTIAKLSAPIAPFFMDRLYQDLNSVTGKETSESIHLADFPVYNESFVDKGLEHKMESAQTISSLVLSLRAKEKIKVRQPLQKIMIPVDSVAQKEAILAVADLIKNEVNIKEIQILDDASEILIKQIKPNFKTLGPKFGKDMRFIAAEVQKFNQEDINKIEKDKNILLIVNGKNITLELADVEISSKDIEGWLVANEGLLTVALDVTISEELRKEGVARELVNRIQNARKDTGLEVTDKIKLTVLNFENLQQSISDNKEYIMSETLTKELVFVDALSNGTEIEFDTIKSRILIEKM
ncbi:MAG: isoleucyl-tRNA synthetase, partial [Polaribacter sp.]